MPMPTTRLSLSLLWLLLYQTHFAAVWSLAFSSSTTTPTRRSFLQETWAAGVVTLATTTTAVAADNNGKLSLSDAELAQLVRRDVVERQFLVTGNLTRSIYAPTAQFTDEIDTYPLEQWVRGTRQLFVSEQSHVRLVGDVDVRADQIEFRFDEDLMFRIPFRPVVSLSGRVVLTRDPETAYITAYREFWDQDVWSVIKTAKFR